MEINRKEFIKKASLSGACLCGFTFLAHPSDSSRHILLNSDNPNVLHQEWISVLLSGIETSLKPEMVRKFLKPCSLAHYNNLKMDDILTPFKGDVDKFCKFLSDNWGWIVNIDKENGVITANENKEQCVCPMVNKSRKDTPLAICYCSEGFAEKMFSTVMEKPVKARVVSSVLRGDKNCVYQINF